MALIDQLGAVDPEEVVSDLISERMPEVAQNGVDPHSVLNRLIRKGMDSRQQRKLQGGGGVQPQQEAPDLGAFGKTQEEVSQEPAPDFASFGSEAPAETGKTKAPDNIGWSEVPGAAAKQFAQSAVKGAASPLKALATGPEQSKIAYDQLKPDQLGAAADPDYNKLAAPYGKEVKARERQQKAAREGIAKSMETPVKDRPLFKAGEAVSEWADKNIPVSDAERQSVVANAAGMVGGAIVPILTGVAGSAINPGLGIAAASSIMGLQSAGDTFERAKAAGATDEAAAKAAGLSGVIMGATGALPVAMILSPVREIAPGLAGRAWAMLDHAWKSGVTFASVGEAQHYIGEQLAKEFDPKAHYEFDIKRLASELLAGGALGGGMAAFQRRPEAPAAPAAPGSLPSPPPGAAGASSASGGPGGGPAGGPGAGPGGPGAGPGSAGPGAGPSRNGPPPPPFESALRPKLRKVLEAKAAYYKEHDAADIASWSDEQLKEYVNKKFGGGSAKSEDAPQEKAEEKPKSYKPMEDAEVEKTLREFGYDPASMGADTRRATAEMMREAYPDGPPKPKATASEKPAETSTKADAAPESSTGIKEGLHGAGKGMVDGLYDMLWDRVEKGHTVEPGNMPSAVLQAAKKVRDAGGVKTQDEFKAFAQEQAKIERGPNFQADMRALVARHTPKPQEGEKPEGTRAQPVDVKSGDDIARAAEAAAKEYSPEQGEANNRKLGHIKWRGLDGSIEVAAGGTRKGTNPKTGKPWSTTHKDPYGYFKGTVGGDGMHLDVTWGPEPDAGHPVYVIDEKDESTGKFRQHKTFVGYPTPQGAVDAYLGVSTKKHEHIGGVRSLDEDTFVKWVQSGNTKKAISDTMLNAKSKEKAETKTADDAMAGLASMFNEPEAEHHEAVEKAVKATGVNPDEVRPADMRAAAELVANKGMSPEEAFVVAVAHNLVADGHIKPEEAEQVLGHEQAAELLEAGEHGVERKLSAETPSTAAGGKAAEAAAEVDRGGAGSGKEVPERKQPEREADGRERAGQHEGVAAADTAGAENGRGAVDKAAGGERASQADERRAGEKGKPAAKAAVGELPKGFELKRGTFGRWSVTDPDGHHVGTFAKRDDAIAAAKKSAGAALADEHSGLRDDLHEALADAKIPLDTVAVEVEDRAVAIMANQLIDPLDALEAALMQIERQRNDVPEQLLLDFGVTKDAIDAIDSLKPSEDREASAPARGKRAEGSEAAADERESASGARAGELKEWWDNKLTDEERAEQLKEIDPDTLITKRKWDEISEDLQKQLAELHNERAPKRSFKKSRRSGSGVDVIAGDADEIINLQLSKDGPWDFNDTWPAPDAKRVKAIEDEGREALGTSADDVEGVVSVLDETLNSLISDFATLRSAGRLLQKARKGEKPPKKRQTQADWIKELKHDVDLAQQGFADTAAALQEMFSEKAVSAMKVEARRQVLQMEKSTEVSPALDIARVKEARSHNEEREREKTEGGWSPVSDDTLQHYAKGYGLDIKGKSRQQLIDGISELGAKPRQSGSIISNGHTVAEAIDLLKNTGYGDSKVADAVFEKFKAALAAHPDKFEMRGHGDDLDGDGKGWIWRAKTSGGGTMDFAAYGRDHVQIGGGSFGVSGTDANGGGGGSSYPKKSAELFMRTFAKENPPPKDGEKPAAKPEPKAKPAKAKSSKERAPEKPGPSPLEGNAAPAEDFDAAFDSALDATYGKAETVKAASPDDALKGLTELFNGPKADPDDFGPAMAIAPNGGAQAPAKPAFSEETYAKARPMFTQAAAKFGHLSNNLGALVGRMVQQMQQAHGLTREGQERMRPYLKRFVEDVRAGAVKLPSAVAESSAGEHIKGQETVDERGQSGSHNQEALDNVPSGEGASAEGGQPSQRGNPSDSAPGGRGDRNAEEGGLSGARGAGSGASQSGVSDAGAGSGSAAGAAGGKRGSRTRVPRQPADVGSAEAPSIPGINFKITPDVELGRGAELEKFNDNLAAIRIVKATERENRRATPDEQRALARYVGWGGLANAFADRTTGVFKTGWEKRGAALAELLTPEELRAARSSTRNAHYTSETVVRAMWEGAKRLGFKGGLTLETSAGTGNFLGLIPQDLAARTKFIAVEQDAITSRIAKLLYPQATVLHAGLQEVPLADGEAILNIGNPPFGAESLRFQFKPELHKLSIHNQFFLAGIDAVRPGGLQINVVSRYLLDAKDDTARRLLATKADLLGVIRLPDTAFKENARTEVVTDIVFLKRRSPDDEAAMQEAFDTLAGRNNSKTDKAGNADRMRSAERRVPDWVRTTEVRDPAGGEAITVNSYFARHKDMIVGQLERSGSMREQNDVTVTLPPGVDFAEALRERINKLPQNAAAFPDDVLTASLDRHKSMAEALEIAVAGEEPGHIAKSDGKLVLTYEKETPTGGYELARRTLSPQSPWSRQLYVDDAGKWFTLSPKLNEKGEKVKVGEKGKRNVYERQYFTDNNIPGSMRLGEQKFERLKQAVDLRDLTKRQIVLETNDAPAAEMEANRLKLAKAYKAYVAEHGLLNDPKNVQLVSDMPDGALVMALELSYRPAITNAKAARTGEKVRPAQATPAPIMSRRVVPKYEPATKADTPHDALSITLSERGRVDMDRVAELLQLLPDEAAAKLQEGDKPLVFFDPEENGWMTANDYLSGQVARKLKAAKAENLARNVKALEAVQPEPWTADQINAQVGSTWVPPAIYADFAEHLIGGKSEVRFAPVTNSFALRVTGQADPAKIRNWRTDDIPFEGIFGGMLNSRVPKVIRDDGERKWVDQEATALVALKAKEIENEFADWVFKSPDRRNQLVQTFNEKFNTRVNRQHDGSHLQLPGKVPDEIIKLRRHQKNAVWRGIHERFTLLDHVVGAGKTFTAIARAMERRRMGLSRKPMVAVPNHLVEQWTSDVYRLYPGAKVLAAGAKQFDRQSRRRLFAKVATGDWDLVIVPHSSFHFIGISKDTELRFLDHELHVAQEAVKEAEQQAAEDGIASGRSKPFNVKEAERLVTTIETRMDKLKKSDRDKLLTFEQMGVDDLTVDEAHEFKNLFYSSRLTGVRGMGDKTGSQKAFDLYNKVRVLTESPTGTVTFMTGTPISNSAVEMFTMMRYLAAKDLKELGLEHFDAWRAQSVSATPKFEPTESGGLKEVTRLGRSWSNMRALMELYYSFTDAVSQEDITTWYAKDNNGAPFPVPRVKDNGRKEVVVKPTQAQLGILQQVIDGFNGLPGIADPYERNATRLRLMDRARKVSLDARAVDPRIPTNEKGGKLEAIANEVTRIYKAWHADKGTQLVFLDRSVKAAKQDTAQIKAYEELIAKRDKAKAEGDEATYRATVDKLDEYDANEIAELRRAQLGGWNAYDQLKQNLIARGIPADEVRFVQEANTDAEKKAIFDAVNDGSIRVLIGSTPRMGAGTNVQERIVGLHHGDVTWKPSDIEQREGRGIRQGNKLLDKYGHDKFELEIKAYVTERTVDAKMWDLNSTKLRMINGIRKYDGSFTMEFEDEDAVGMAEIAALASGDPMLLERVKLMAEIDRLELQERAFRRRMFGLDDAIQNAEQALRDYPEQIEAVKKAAAELQGPYQQLQDAAAKRTVDVEGTTYTSALEAVTAVEKAIAAQKGGDENAKYSIAVNGQRLTTKDLIETALQNAFGDKDAFEVKADGETMLRRSQFAKIIQGKIDGLIKSVPAGEEPQAVKIGTMLGGDIEVQVENDAKASVVDLALTKGGRTLAAARRVQDKSMTVSLQAARSLLDSLESDIDDVRTSTGERMQKRMAQAEAELPGLRADKGKPFAQAAPLAEKRARLKAVIDELAARTKAAEAPGGPKPFQPIGEDEGEAAGSAQPSRGLTDLGERLRQEEVAKRRALQPDREVPLEQTELGRNLTALIHKITGKRVTVEFRDEMLAGGTPLGWGMERAPQTIGGRYFPLKDVIRLALSDHRFPDKVATAFHEAWHGIEDHFVSEPEMALLRRENNRLRERAAAFFGERADAFENVSDFEIRAMAFQAYASDRARGGHGAGFHIGVRRIFDRLMELLRRIANYLRGLGHQTAEDVFAKAYEGQMKERPSRKLDEGQGSRITESLLAERAAVDAAETARAERAVPVAAQVVSAAMAKVPEKVISAAVQAEGRVFAGTMHSDAYDAAAKGFGRELQTSEFKTGFITNDGRFVDRDEAGATAARAGQTVNPITGNKDDKITGPLHADNLGAWDEADIERNNQALTDATRDPDDLGAAMAWPFSRGTGPTAPGAGPSIAERIRDGIAAMLESRFARKVSEGYSDLSAPVRRLQKELEERRGAPFSDLGSFYTRKRVYPGRVGHEVDQFNRAHLDPMIDYMKANGVTLQAGGDYVYAKHVVERNAELGRLYPADHPFHQAMFDRTIVGASGRSREWAEDILREVARQGKTAQFERVAQHIAEIREYVLHRMEQGHLISAETAQAWRAKYRDYVDLRGFEDEPADAPESFHEARRFHVRGKEVKEAFGRGSKAANPIVNMLDQAYRAIDRAERNHYLHAVWNALGRMNADNPASLHGIVRLDHGKPKKMIDPLTGLVKIVSDSSYAGLPETVTTKINGNPRHMVFDSREMAEAIKRMSPESLGMFQGIVVLQNKLKALWTHYSPDFLVRHFLFRYPIEGTLNSFEQKESGDHSVAKYIQQSYPFLGSASKAIFATHRGERHANAEVRALQDYWNEMRKAGGAMVFRASRDIDLLHEHLQLRLRELSGKPIATAREKYRRAIEALDVVTNTLDNALRLAAYATARRQGKSPQQSALIAREATVDFQLKGKWANAIALWFPFGNVAIQTGLRMTKAVGRSKIMRRVFMGTVLAGFLTAMFNYLIGGDDKDGIPFFEKIPEWDRQLNFILLNPFDRDEKGRPQPIKIPMPYNWAFPLMVGYGMGTKVFGKESVRHILGMIAHSGLEVLTPFGQEKNKAALLAPEMTRPFVHVYTNEDYTGRPIHQNPNFQKGPNAESGRRPVGDRVRTGEGWHYIARGLNSATGGSRTKSGALDFYPEDIRHVLDYVGGTQRRLAGNIYETVTKPPFTEKHNPTRIPLARVVRGTDYDAADRALRFERAQQQKRPWLPH